MWVDQIDWVIMEKISPLDFQILIITAVSAGFNLGSDMDYTRENKLIGFSRLGSYLTYQECKYDMDKVVTYNQVMEELRQIIKTKRNEVLDY